MTDINNWKAIVLDLTRAEARKIIDQVEEPKRFAIALDEVQFQVEIDKPAYLILRITR